MVLVQQVVVSARPLNIVGSKVPVDYIAIFTYSRFLLTHAGVAWWSEVACEIF